MNTIIIENRTRRNLIDNEFQNIKWVLKARVKKDVSRKNLMGCYASQGTLTATDGHRLHTCSIDRNIPDGPYDVKSANDKLIVLESSDNIYPEYERLFPQISPERKSLYCNGFDGWFLKEAFIMAGEYGFNPEYLHDAYINDADVFMQKKDGLKPLMVYDSNFTRAALIMPINKQNT